MARTQQEVLQRAVGLLQQAWVTDALRQECVQIASAHAPSSAYDRGVLVAAQAGCSQMEQISCGKAARWLSVLSRDFGPAALHQAAQLLGLQIQWRLASGERVVDRPDSHLHGTVATLLPEVFAHLHAAGRDLIVCEHDFTRVVGKTNCIRTFPGDEIVFAQRPGRQGLTRFVKNRLPEPCQHVTVVLKWLPSSGAYEIRTAYIGRRAEPEPWDKYATVESIRFWQEHALIWGSEPTIPGTEVIPTAVLQHSSSSTETNNVTTLRQAQGDREESTMSQNVNPKLATALALAPRLGTTTQRVVAKFIDREEVVKTALLALITDAAAFYLSPPGTGKTATVGELAQQIKDLVFYEALMPGVPNPDQLFVESTKIVEHIDGNGDKSIAVSQKLGRAAKAHLFFADEIWKTDPSVLNPLLDLARADGVRHEGAFVETPILGFLGASNELPDEGSILEALWSRMIIRVQVRPLDESGRKRMVRARLHGFQNGKVPEPAPEISVEDIKTLQAARAFVELPDSVLDQVLEVIQQLVDQDADGFRWLQEDDRRFGFICDVLQAHALMNGRAAVSSADLTVLRWMLWNTPEQIPAVEAVVLPLCRTPLGECRELVDTLLSTGGIVDQVCQGQAAQAVNALTQVNACKSQLTAKAGQLSGSDAQKVQTWVQALSSLTSIIAMGVGGSINRDAAQAAYTAVKAALN